VVQEINISKVPVKKITFDETNPNILTDEQMKSLKKTMEKFGFLAPVILNKDLQVIDGEHRVRIYQELGKKTIQAYVIDVNTINKKMLRQLMNKLRGEHDKQKDAEEFKLIFEAGKLNEFSELLATQAEEFQTVLEKKFDIGFEKAEEQEIPETPTKPKAKVGDIYQLGKHRIMCGDSTKNINLLLDKIKVDLLFTDPPYGIDIVSKLEVDKQDGVIDRSAKLGFTAHTQESSNFEGNIIHRRKYKQIIGDDKPFDPSFLLDKGIIIILFGANHYTDKLPVCSHWLVWDKKAEVGHDSNTFSDVELMWTNIFKRKSAKIYRHLWSGLLRAGDRKLELKDRVHPTQKPVGLLSEIIKDYTEKNHIVLDPYLGSGSTLIACEQTDRICYGMELDPAYIDVIIERWENYTGKKAKKL
jgi:DNA modification methylase